MTRAELLAYIDSNVYPNANNEITALMVRDVLHRMVGFMGDAATYGVGDVAPSDPGLVTGGAVQGAINTALSAAIKFQGVTTTPLTDGSTDPDIVIAGDPYTAHRGDEVIYGGREFLWTGSMWQQLGDEQSWALKTITISAGAGLVGGGDLTQNRTISLSQDSLDKLTAAGTIASYFSGGKLVASHLPDLYLARTLVSSTAANKTLYGVDGISHAAAADNTDKSRIVWDADNDAWHFYGNIYTDGWYSGGGISPGGGGGGGGIDPVAMWRLLTNNPSLTQYDNYTKISADHINFPVTSVVGLTGAVSAAQIAAALGLGSLAYKSSLSVSDIPDLSGTYLPLSAGSGKALTGDLYLGNHAISGATTISASSRINTSYGFVTGDTTDTGIWRGNNWTDALEAEDLAIVATGHKMYLYASTHYFTGRVGIQTSTPAYPLDVNGEMRTNGGIFGKGWTIPGRSNLLMNSDTAKPADIIFRSGTYTAGTWGDWAISSRGNENGNNSFCIGRGAYNAGNPNESVIFVINPDGNVIIGQNVFDATTTNQLDVRGVIHATTGIYTDGWFSGGGVASSSDRRLKKNIKNFAYTPKLLLAIRPREWDWKDSSAMVGHAAGFVAQEIEGVMPYAVDGTRNYKALFYDRFHALEIAGLQDHERRIVDLERAVKERDKKIEKLEKKLKMN